MVQKSKLKKHQRETLCAQTLTKKQKEVDLSNENRDVDRRHLEAALFNTAIVEALKKESDAQNEEVSIDKLISVESNKCDGKIVLNESICENVSNEQQELDNAIQEGMNTNMKIDDEACLVQKTAEPCVLPDLVSLSLHLSSTSSSSCLTFSSPSREAVEALLAVLGGLRLRTSPATLTVL